MPARRSRTPPPPPPRRAAHPAQLRIIRAFLFATPVLLGTFAAWVRHTKGAPPPNANAALVRWGAYALCAVSLAVMYWFRTLRARRPVEERASYSIIGWALAEGAALLGAVVLLLSGDYGPYAFGLLLMAASWAWFPADPERLS